MKNNLRTLRKQRGITQLQLQIATGIEFENGSRIPPTETLITLADFYGVSMDYIMMRTDVPAVNGRPSSSPVKNK